jgi:hypothetical protein
VIQALFLSCALALPPANFTGPDLIREIHEIHSFIEKHYPGSQVVIVPEEQRPPSPPWERTILDWNGMEVWIKRPTIHDMGGPNDSHRGSHDDRRLQTGVSGHGAINRST